MSCSDDDDDDEIIIVGVPTTECVLPEVSPSIMIKRGVVRQQLGAPAVTARTAAHTKDCACKECTAKAIQQQLIRARQDKKSKSNCLVERAHAGTETPVNAVNVGAEQEQIRRRARDERLRAEEVRRRLAERFSKKRKGLGTEALYGTATKGEGPDAKEGDAGNGECSFDEAEDNVASGGAARAVSEDMEKSREKERIRLEMGRRVHGLVPVKGVCVCVRNGESVRA